MHNNSARAFSMIQSDDSPRSKITLCEKIVCTRKVINRRYKPEGKSLTEIGVGWTLNQRVPGSSPGAPTKTSNRIK